MDDGYAGPGARGAASAAERQHLIGWLNNEAYRLTHPRDLVQETCRRLVAAGVPLEVFTAWVLLLHPDYFGASHRWRRDTDEVVSGVGGHDLLGTSLVDDSPLAYIRQGADAYRRRLCDQGPEPGFPVLEEYFEGGSTDYVCMRLPFSDHSANMISFTTDRPGGFTTDELATVDAILPYISRLTEIQATRYLATALLDVYVGHQTGAEILSGTIRRGHGRTLDAVILMTDLQDFTALSNTLPRDALIALLNDYFDAFGTPIQERGGEILKFIGDAMLAIFPVKAGNRADRCQAALEAAREGLARIGALNAERAAAGRPRVACGAALHIGEVMYGNVGAGARLDFTVIGPAVNLAARLEGLTRALDEPLVLSADFASAAGCPTTSLGSHAVKGFDAPIEVLKALG